MGIKTKIVIFNEETNKHEPIAAGDVISETLLPPPRKAWLGNIDCTTEFVAQGIDYGTVPDLEVGSTYMVANYDPTDDFSNVGQGTDASLPFVATGTTPAKWKNSIVYKLIDELTVTEHHNTIGFTVTGSLRVISGEPSVVLTTSVPYWNRPLSTYNTAKLNLISDTEAFIVVLVVGFHDKVLLELL